MIQIIPAVLATTEEEFKEQILKIKASDVLEGDWIHIDFMDNKFTQNPSIDEEVVERYDIPFRKEAHLMLENSTSKIAELKKAGFERIIVHAESENVEANLQEIKSLGLEVGLAIEFSSSIDLVRSFLPLIDVLLVLTVKPGFQGQEFAENGLDLLSEIKKIRDEGGFNFKIEVDGGVTPDNAKQIVDAGAEYLVVGSHLVEGDIEENLEAFWEVLNS